MCYTKKIGEKYASFSHKRFFYCPYRPFFEFYKENFEFSAKDNFV